MRWLNFKSVRFYSDTVKKSFDNTKTIERINQNIKLLISKQNVDPTEDSKTFQIFNQLHSVPVRYKVPKSLPNVLVNKHFSALDQNDKNLLFRYFKELTRFKYFQKDDEVYRNAVKIYNRFKEVPEIKVEFIHFLFRKRFASLTNKLINKENLLESNRPDIFIEILQGGCNLWKNSKLSVNLLEDLVERMIKNDVQMNCKLIYYLNCTLPKQSAHVLRQELSNKLDDEVFNNIFYDLKYSEIAKFNELESLLRTNEIDFTVNSYLKVVRLMISENRVHEGLNLIKYLTFKHQIEIPFSLNVYLLLKINSKFQFLTIPTMAFIMRFNNLSLESVAVRQLFKNLMSVPPTLQTFTLIKLLASFRYAKTQDDFQKFQKDFDAKYSNFKELPENYQSLVRECRYFFRRDEFFKPGYFDHQYLEMFKLFPTFQSTAVFKQKLDSNETSILDKWELFLFELNKNDNNVFKAILFMDKLFENAVNDKKFYGTIITTSNYISKNHGVDVRFYVFSKLIKSITNNENLVFNEDAIDIEFKICLAILRRYRLKVNDFTKSDNIEVISSLITLSQSYNKKEPIKLFALINELEFSIEDFHKPKL